MSLAKLGENPAPLSWINKGWSALQDYAHNAITHFQRDDKEAEDSADGSGVWGVIAADVVEHNDVVEARFEIPGMSRSDLTVKVAGGCISVTGERQMSSTRECGNVHIMERAFGRFERRIALPVDVDTSRAKARYDKGVLTVTMPRGLKSNRSAIPIG